MLTEFARSCRESLTSPHKGASERSLARPPVSLARRNAHHKADSLHACNLRTALPLSILTKWRQEKDRQAHRHR